MLIPDKYSLRLELEVSSVQNHVRKEMETAAGLQELQVDLHFNIVFALLETEHNLKHKH